MLLRSVELFQEAQRAFKDEVHKMHSSRAQSAALPRRSPAASARVPARPETAPAKPARVESGNFRVQRIPRTSSPFLRARILRTRERQIEDLCSFGGPGVSPDTNGRIYAEKMLTSEALDLDVAALISAWLTEALRPPWHFHLSRGNGRLYFVHDDLGVASSEHPDERAMRRLMDFADKVRTQPDEGVRLLHMEISEIDARARRQLETSAPDFEGWLEEEPEEGNALEAGRAEAAKTEIKEQRERLVKVLKQYVSRIGVPKISLKTMAYEKNAVHRKFIKSKQALDSAVWLQRKFEDKNLGSETTLKYNKHHDEIADSISLKLKRSSLATTQLT